jgi:beta-lactam-binding protein with PASTA domain
MKINLPFQDNKIGSLLANIGIVTGILLLLFVIYFYIYLPNVTNHGKFLTVPDYTGIDQEELKTLIAQNGLRYSIEDSSYSADLPPYTVVRQFPKAGVQVKKNRLVYITINKITAPTMPVPNLVDRSLTNAELILKSNELVRGQITYEPDPFKIIKKMVYKGKLINAGTRVPKNSVIDLVVGDGDASAALVIESLIGDSYSQAIFKLVGWNLHLGKVQIPADMDTTGMAIFVYKQHPKAGDSVRVGDPVTIWVGPKGYSETENDNKN